VRSFYGFHIEVALPFLLQNCCIPAVGKRTRVPVAHSSEVVFVSAESLLNSFGFEGAVAIIDDVPNGVVLYH